MKEIAFTVNPDSELYANHFIQKAEKKRFAELASAYPNTFYYVNEKGEAGPCLANLNFFSIRLVFMLKNRD